MKRFYSSLLIIAVALLSGATEPDAGAHAAGITIAAGALPAADRPDQAARRLMVAYCNRDLASYGALLTADFQFESRDPEFLSAHPAGFTRDDEIASADHLFHGFVNADGMHLPAAGSIELIATGERLGSANGSPAGAAVFELDEVRLAVRLVDGTSFMTEPMRDSFWVVPAETARLAPGQVVEPGHWLIQHWVESPEPVLAAVTRLPAPPDASPPPYTAEPPQAQIVARGQARASQGGRP